MFHNYTNSSSLFSANNNGTTTILIILNNSNNSNIYFAYDFFIDFGNSTSNNDEKLSSEK